MYPKKVDCTPFGFTEGERFLKRKKEPFFTERQWKILLFAAAIAFLSALMFFLTTVFHVGTVEAAGMNLEDVHSLEASCAYAGLYPEKIVNLKELSAACKNNGTPIDYLN